MGKKSFTENFVCHIGSKIVTLEQYIRTLVSKVSCKVFVSLKHFSMKTTQLNHFKCDRLSIDTLHPRYQAHAISFDFFSSDNGHLPGIPSLRELPWFVVYFTGF